MVKSAQAVKASAALAQPARLAIYRLPVECGTEGMAAYLTENCCGGRPDACKPESK